MSGIFDQIARIIVGRNLPTAESSLLLSRIALLSARETTDFDAHDFAYHDTEDANACLQTLFFILAGVLAYQVGFNVLGWKALAVGLFWMPAAETYSAFLWLLISLGIGCIIISCIGMAIATRWPVLGFWITAVVFLATMLFMGGMFSGHFFLGLIIPLAICSGVYFWAKATDIKDPILLFTLRTCGLLAGLFSVLLMAYFADWNILVGLNRAVWFAKILIPIAFVLVSIGYGAFLGFVFQATTSASSPNLSSFTTSAYALGIVSVGVWGIFILKLMLRMWRRRHYS